MSIAIKTDEFCQKGNLEKYRSIIEELFQKIYSSGCQISARENSTCSVHENTNGKCIIRIFLKRDSDYYRKPEHIIWTIFHEFGHHQIGAIAKKEKNNWEKRVESEENAWKYARKEVLKFSLLAKHIEDFDDYKNECLKEYKKRINVR